MKKEFKILSIQLVTDMKMIIEELENEDIDWQSFKKEVHRINKKVREWGDLVSDIIEEKDAEDHAEQAEQAKTDDFESSRGV